ncbi:MAG: hypothetical protein ACF8LL_15125, partial [Phycisphaerales bacterium]
MLRTICIPLIIVPWTIMGCHAQPIRDAENKLPGEQRSSQTAAIINGVAVDLNTLQDGLSEAAGAQVLREYVLDRALNQRCEDLGIQIDTDKIAAERSLLGDSLGAETNQAIPTEVLDTLRAERGLGPQRFQRLLRRNAMLRALAGSPEPSPELIEQAVLAAFGTRYRIRLFVSESPEAAQAARSAVSKAEPSGQRWVFAEACVSSSIHPSAARGGLIEALSPASSSYPSAILAALPKNQAGTCSPVISTEAGYALVYVEQV